MTPVETGGRSAWRAGPSSDPRAGRHFDGPALRVVDESGEQIQYVRPYFAARLGAGEGALHGGDGGGRPAGPLRHVRHPGCRSLLGPRAVPYDDGYCPGVLDRALPAEAVADAALDEKAEDAGDLRPAADDGPHLRTGLQDSAEIWRPDT
ncbi:hypothetical protein [Streptomyces sp. TRM49041]|uniref:hypothetical protein n=1 Tax=Streptomyces sp. TRM49041 TaxID=2603216 RepID=UPI0016568BCD